MRVNREVNPDGLVSWLEAYVGYITPKLIL
jgi:hypothetical protein